MTRFDVAALLVLLCIAPVPAHAQQAHGGVVYEYIAHASFRLTAEDGARLGVDPYADGVWLGYAYPQGIAADAVLVTHPHYDHDGGEYRGGRMPFPPDTRVIRFPGEFSVGGFAVTGLEGRHAEPYGAEFGRFSTVYVIEAAGPRGSSWSGASPIERSRTSPSGERCSSASADTRRALLADSQPRFQKNNG